jgi:hypothetical protein
MTVCAPWQRHPGRLPRHAASGYRERLLSAAPTTGTDRQARRRAGVTLTCWCRGMRARTTSTCRRAHPAQRRGASRDCRGSAHPSLATSCERCDWKCFWKAGCAHACVCVRPARHQRPFCPPEPTPACLSRTSPKDAWCISCAPRLRHATTRSARSLTEESRTGPGGSTVRAAASAAGERRPNKPAELPACLAQAVARPAQPPG